MLLSKQLFAIGTSLVLGGNLLVASPSQTMNQTELPRRITIAVDESDSFGTICKVIAKLMGIDVSEIKKSSTLIADLGMDSLDLVEVVMECEKQLSVSFPDEMWNKLGKNAAVKDLVDAFNSLLGKVEMGVQPSYADIHFDKTKTDIKVKGTPYEMLAALLEAGGFPTAELSLETLLPIEVFEGVMPSLRKNMKIRDKVVLPPLPGPASVSEVLTAVMQAKYEGKDNKNADFEKIRYSLNSSDFDRYIATYPKSKHVEEAEARRKCAKLHEDWVKTSDSGSRVRQKVYANIYYSGGKQPLDAPEGYESLVNLDYQRAKAIASWYDMIQAESDTYWLTDGIIDCSIYADYLDEYGKYSCLTDVATDSLNSCLERKAWREADMEKTIASYQSYVDEFPDGNHARYAKKKLGDWKAWQTAREKNNYAGYCDYYEEYPEGDSVALAIPYMQQKEQQWWDNAQKKNTLAAYDDFIDRFPKGYYSSEAKNRAGEMRLDGVKDQKETISGIEEIGKYSQLGYSLVGLANLDKGITMTVSLIGKTGQKVVLKHGTNQWVKVKNGKYKILVQASGHENWWGNVEFENKIYADGWYSTPNFLLPPRLDAEAQREMDKVEQLYAKKAIDGATYFQRRMEIISASAYDKEAFDSFKFEAILKVLEEMGKMEE